ncbi:hypothetical protein ABFS82_06G116700 [Erythranthe guttata]
MIRSSANRGKTPNMKNIISFVEVFSKFGICFNISTWNWLIYYKGKKVSSYTYGYHLLLVILFATSVGLSHDRAVEEEDRGSLFTATFFISSHPVLTVTLYLLHRAIPQTITLANKTIDYKKWHNLERLHMQRTISAKRCSLVAQAPIFSWSERILCRGLYICRMLL